MPKAGVLAESDFKLDRTATPSVDPCLLARTCGSASHFHRLRTPLKGALRRISESSTPALKKPIKLVECVAPLPLLCEDEEHFHSLGNAIQLVPREERVEFSPDCDLSAFSGCASFGLFGDLEDEVKGPSKTLALESKSTPCPLKEERVLTLQGSTRKEPSRPEQKARDLKGPTRGVKLPSKRDIVKQKESKKSSETLKVGVSVPTPDASSSSPPKQATLVPVCVTPSLTNFGLVDQPADAKVEAPAPDHGEGESASWFQFLDQDITPVCATGIPSSAYGQLCVQHPYPSFTVTAVSKRKFRRAKAAIPFWDSDIQRELTAPWDCDSNVNWIATNDYADDRDSEPQDCGLLVTRIVLLKSCTVLADTVTRRERFIQGLLGALPFVHPEEDVKHNLEYQSTHPEETMLRPHVGKAWRFGTKNPWNGKKRAPFRVKPANVSAVSYSSSLYSSERNAPIYSRLFDELFRVDKETVKLTHYRDMVSKDATGKYTIRDSYRKAVQVTALGFPEARFWISNDRRIFDNTVLHFCQQQLESGMAMSEGLPTRIDVPFRQRGLLSLSPRREAPTGSE